MPSPEVTQRVLGSYNVFTGVGNINVKYELPPLEAGDHRNLLILKDRVKRFWLDGVLANSLYNAVQLSLGKAMEATAVERPWEMLLEIPNRPTDKITSDKEITDVFDEVGRTLLILGEPGSGKTITLLQLARDLIRRSEGNLNEPVPLVLSLASWSNKRHSFLEWAIRELRSKYFIPRRISGPWLRDNRLFLLLDGLDQVPERSRVSCVEAINSFVEEVGIPGIAISSRLIEYTSLPVRLKLNGAVRLQPLTAKQIDTYINNAGPELGALKEALHEDSSLREFACSPLMLSVMSLAQINYDDRLSEYRSTTVEDHRAQIFNLYVNRMFERKRPSAQPYCQTTTIRWLTFLAQNMSKRSEAIFMLEGLQPSWLSPGKRLWIYLLSSRICLALVLGVASLGIVILSSPYTPPGEQVNFVLFSIWAGLIASLLDGLTIGRSMVASNDDRISTRQVILRIVILTLILGPAWNVASIIITSRGNFVEVLKDVKSLEIFGDDFGMIRGLACALVFGLGRNRINSDIMTVESLKWTLRRTLRAIPVACLIGLFVWCAVTLPFAGNLLRGVAVLESKQRRRDKLEIELSVKEKEVDDLDKLWHRGFHSREEEEFAMRILRLAGEKENDENASRVIYDELYVPYIYSRLLRAGRNDPAAAQAAVDFVEQNFDKINEQEESRKERLEEDVETLRSERADIEGMFEDVFEDGKTNVIDPEYEKLNSSEVRSTFRSLAPFWLKSLSAWVILGGAIGFIFSGFTGRLAESKARPNQGIRLSIRNALFAATLIGLPAGVLTALSYALINSIGVSTIGPASVESIPKFEIPLDQLLVFGAYAATLGAFWYGGSAVIKHYALRLNLYCEGSIPRDYANFLNYCSSLIFLQKVGAGYIFVHPLLQDHFANCYKPMSGSMNGAPVTVDLTNHQLKNQALASPE